MSYQRVLGYLRKVEQRGIILGLQNTREILRRFPSYFDFDPGRTTFIQVAGTNGKGSVAHYLTSILHSGGSKTGLFTSPHLHDIRERVTISGEWITEAQFAAAVWDIKKLSGELLEKKLIGHIPTYFEYIFLVAVYHFYREKVGAAILEVGLGGRLDATSTITPAASVITGISHDHSGTLGKRIKDIAFEKAGIIKKGVPVVCGCSVHSVSNSVIKKKARELEAPFHNVFDSKNRLEVEELPPTGRNSSGYRCRYTTPGGSYPFDVHMNGRHQPDNAAVAVKTVQVLNSTNTTGFDISTDSIRIGIKSTRFPCRIEELEVDTNPPGKIKIILDAGHNVESIRVLKNFLEQKRKRRLTLIFGVLADKNYKQMVRLLLPFIKNVIVTEPGSKRALPAEELIPLFRGKEDVLVRKDYVNAFLTAKKWQEEILITGSFYLVGEMRHIIKHGGQ
ncbi:MAG: bifunctional folylpolyglutamate synthase/dihydrofolate synthase [bacterium]|nr:bifunctional folylpolyglutamate synthase/dihydrofolate synthase [bacterium]